MAVDKEKLKETIKSLLTKSSDSGASASEAAACMAKAQKLMKKNDISESDLAHVEADEYRYRDEMGRRTRDGKAAFHPIDRFLGLRVAKFCGCIQYWDITTLDNKRYIRYFGRDMDVEYCVWMLESFKQQADNEWRIYKNKRASRRNVDLVQERVAFYRSWSRAVWGRMEAWVCENDELASDGSGTALALVKSDLTIRRLGELGVHLGSGGPMGKMGHNDKASAAGAMAGGRADVGRSVNKGGQVLLGSPQS